MDGHTTFVLSYSEPPAHVGPVPNEPPTQTMQTQLLIGLLLAPVFVASCANKPEARNAPSSTAVPNAPKVVFEIEGMT